MHTQFEYFVNARLGRQFIPTQEHLHRADAQELYQRNLHERRLRRRFFQLYRLRNLLFRVNPRLANWLTLAPATNLSTPPSASRS